MATPIISQDSREWSSDPAEMRSQDLFDRACERTTEATAIALLLPQDVGEAPVAYELCVYASSVVVRLLEEASACTHELYTRLSAFEKEASHG